MIPSDSKVKYNYGEKHRKKTCEDCGGSFSIDFFPSTIRALCRICAAPEKPKERSCLVCNKVFKTVKSVRTCGPCKGKDIYRSA